MEGREIKARIDENNSKIEQLLNPNFFVLNNAIADLLKENEELQKQCQHLFNEEGYCLFCYKKRGK